MFRILTWVKLHGLITLSTIKMDSFVLAIWSAQGTKSASEHKLTTTQGFQPTLFYQPTLTVVYYSKRRLQITSAGSCRIM